jgi:hypothetical protein
MGIETYDNTDNKVYARIAKMKPSDVEGGTQLDACKDSTNQAKDLKDCCLLHLGHLFVWSTCREPLKNMVESESK